MALNLDIGTYTKNDLFNLFSIDESENEYNILQKYELKIKGLEDLTNLKLKAQLVKFFNSAYEKIKYKMEDIRPVLDIQNPPVYPTFPIKYPLGKINPIEKKVTTEILCLDTIFRDIIKNPETSDFVYNLPNPVENVVSMKLISAEIPDIQTTFLSSRTNNSFNITMFNGWVYKDSTLTPMPIEGSMMTVTVPDGLPHETVFIQIIQNQLDSRRDSFSYLKIGIDEVSFTFFFRFKTLIECINWNASYNVDNSINSSLRTAPDNQYLTSLFRMPSFIRDDLNPYREAHDDLLSIYLGTTNYPMKDIRDKSIRPLERNAEGLKYMIDFNPTNLSHERTIGWTMGFRDVKILKSLKHNKKYIYTSNNLPFFNNLNNVKIFGYIPACTPFVDAPNAYYFLYVNDFVGNYNDTLNVLQRDNIFAKSLLAKIQLEGSHFNIKYVNSNSISILEKTRDYFGPVTIKKLHIKLIDKYNKPINTRGVNYSLTLQFEKLYSNINN